MNQVNSNWSKKELCVIIQKNGGLRCNLPPQIIPLLNFIGLVDENSKEVLFSRVDFFFDFS